MKQVQAELTARHRKKPPTDKEVAQAVREAQRAQAVWHNNSFAGTVRAAKCHERGVESASGDILPCGECRGLLQLKTFQNSLRKEPPDPENAKFTPKAYLDEIGGKAFLQNHDVKWFMTVSPS